MLSAVISLIVSIGMGCVFGVATNSIIRNKGYRDNWFWWGFFFGIIAMLVALSKPELPRMRETDNEDSYFGGGGSIVGPNYVFKGFGYEDKVDAAAGGWRCQNCGKVNASYVGTCGCGAEKSGGTLILNPVKLKQNEWKCSRCGKINPNYVGTCGCGNEKAEQAVQEEEKVAYCPSCGKQIGADSTFCQYCGGKVI